MDVEFLLFVLLNKCAFTMVDQPALHKIPASLVSPVLSSVLFIS